MRRGYEMKIEINNEKTRNKPLSFEENFWTGKRTIIYDGTPLKKTGRATFEYKKEEITEQFVVNGNQAIGTSISMFGEKIELVRKPYWYEAVLSILSFVASLIIVVVGASLGMLGFGLSTLFGALCGAFGGAFAFTSITLSRKIPQVWLRILFMVEVLVLCILICLLFAHTIFKAF